MARREDVIDAIWDTLHRHHAVVLTDMRDDATAVAVRCACQPVDALAMTMATWHRHVAEQAAEAAHRFRSG